MTFLFGEKHAIARERNIMPKQQFIHRKGGRWKKEDRMVLEHKMTDSQLSRIIHHSVKAIQVRRSRLTHNTKSAAVLLN